MLPIYLLLKIFFLRMIFLPKCLHSYYFFGRNILPSPPFSSSSTLLPSNTLNPLNSYSSFIAKFRYPCFQEACPTLPPYVMQINPLSTLALVPFHSLPSCSLHGPHYYLQLHECLMFLSITTMSTLG